MRTMLMSFFLLLAFAAASVAQPPPKDPPEAASEKIVQNEDGTWPSATIPAGTTEIEFEASESYTMLCPENQADDFPTCEGNTFSEFECDDNKLKVKYTKPSAECSTTVTLRWDDNLPNSEHSGTSQLDLEPG